MNELENVNPFRILADSLARIEQMLASMIENMDLNDKAAGAGQTELLSIAKAAEFLGLSKQAVYRHIGKISHYKRNGRLYFKRDELVEYVEQGKRVARKSVTARR